MRIDSASVLNSAGSFVAYGPGVIGIAAVDGLGSSWTFSDPLSVGHSENSFGTLSISAGASVTVADILPYEASYLGYWPGSRGQIVVDGVGTTWTSSGGLSVGYYGDGTLDIIGGGTVSNTTGSIGTYPDSTGTATVTGTDSIWANSESVYVGNQGEGILKIIGGGTVSADGGVRVGYEQRPGHEPAKGMVTVDGFGSILTSSDLILGSYGGVGVVEVTGGAQANQQVAYIGSTGTGRMTVAGRDSRWTLDLQLFVGDAAGTGVLNILNGGTVFSRQAFIGTNFSATTGTVNVEGTGSTWINSGDLSLGTEGNGTVTISDGAWVDLDGDVYLAHYNGHATINLFDAVLRMHNGFLTNNSGTARFNFEGGRFEGPGVIDLGSVFLQNGGTLAPGNSTGTTTIEGGYTLNGGLLEIEINGLGSAGVDWDLVEVNGTVDLVGSNGLLDGLLNVILGFAPSQGDEFLVVANDDTDPIIGAFASWTTVKAPFENNLYQFAIDYAAGDGNDISLATQTVSTLGDYDGNGTVDAADYGVWKLAFGQEVAPYASADGNGNGRIDAADYTVWRDRLGAMSGNGSAGVSPSLVPEPASAMLLVIVILTVVSHKRHRKDTEMRRKIANQVFQFTCFCRKLTLRAMSVGIACLISTGGPTWAAFMATYSGSRLTVTDSSTSQTDTHDLGWSIDQLRPGGTQFGVKGGSYLGVWWAWGHFSVHRLSAYIERGIEYSTGKFAVAGGSVLGVADGPQFFEHDLRQPIQRGIKTTGGLFGVAGTSILGIANRSVFARHEFNYPISRDVAASGGWFAVAGGSYLGIGSDTFFVRHDVGFGIQKGIESFGNRFAVAGGSRLAVGDQLGFSTHNLGEQITTLETIQGTFRVIGTSKFGVWSPLSFITYPCTESICGAPPPPPPPPPSIPGDYNGSGDVDAADYTVWRDMLGVRKEIDYRVVRGFMT